MISSLLTQLLNGTTTIRAISDGTTSTNTTERTVTVDSAAATVPTTTTTTTTPYVSSLDVLSQQVVGWLMLDKIPTTVYNPPTTTTGTTTTTADTTTSTTADATSATSTTSVADSFSTQLNDAMTMVNGATTEQAKMEAHVELDMMILGAENIYNLSTTENDKIAAQAQMGSLEQLKTMVPATESAAYLTAKQQVADALVSLNNATTADEVSAILANIGTYKQTMVSELTKTISTADSSATTTTDTSATTETKPSGPTYLYNLYKTQLNNAQTMLRMATTPALKAQYQAEIAELQQKMAVEWAKTSSEPEPVSGLTASSATTSTASTDATSTAGTTTSSATNAQPTYLYNLYKTQLTNAQAMLKVASTEADKTNYQSEIDNLLQKMAVEWAKTSNTAEPVGAASNTTITATSTVKPTLTTAKASYAYTLYEQQLKYATVMLSSATTPELKAQYQAQVNDLKQKMDNEMLKSLYTAELANANTMLNAATVDADKATIQSQIASISTNLAEVNATIAASLAKTTTSSSTSANAATTTTTVKTPEPTYLYTLYQTQLNNAKVMLSFAQSPESKAEIQAQIVDYTQKMAEEAAKVV